MKAEGEPGRFLMPSSEGGVGGSDDGGGCVSSGGGGNAKYTSIITCMSVTIYGIWIGNWIY
jgi:hypothetical protein